MILSMAFIICTFIFSMMIAIVYFAKKHISTTETRLYNFILVISILNLIIEFVLCVNILLDVDLYSIYNLIINKLFLITLFTWFTLFTIYIVNVAGVVKYNEKNVKVSERVW